MARLKMTDLATIQSWPRDVLERAFTHREDELAKALEAERLARAGFDKAASERDQLKAQLTRIQSVLKPYGVDAINSMSGIKP